MEDNTPLGNGTFVSERLRQGSILILTCFFFAHAIFHFMTQSFSVMLPAIKSTFGINPIQIGALITAKELAAGLAALPGGVLSDYLSHRRALIMTTCMILFGFGWLLIGHSPLYGLLFVGMVIVAVASAVWHLPSLAELGNQFTRSRGAVFALHGAGGSIGDISGPIITGMLLGMLSWRSIISIYSLVPLLMSVLIFWVFRRNNHRLNLPAKQTATHPGKFREQFVVTKEILRKTHIWRVNLVAGFRGMCFTVIITFMPLFMKEQLGFNSAAIGFHVGLLWSIGIVASPLMGYLSDQWGRSKSQLTRIVAIPLYGTLSHRENPVTGINSQVKQGCRHGGNLLIKRLPGNLG